MKASGSVAKIGGKMEDRKNSNRIGQKPETGGGKRRTLRMLKNRKSIGIRMSVSDLKDNCC